MPKKPTPPKKKTAAKQVASGGRRPSACSASLRMIRLVVQLVDTPRNREVMDILQATAKATAVQGPHAAIKREDVQILALYTTRPPQNDLAHGAAGGGNQPQTR